MWLLFISKSEEKTIIVENESVWKMSALVGFATTPVIAHAGLLQHLSQLRLCDIGFNAIDDMFKGEYHGKKCHDSDLPAVLQRAYSSGVEAVLCTASNAQEAQQTLQLCRQLAKTDSGERTCKMYSTVGVHPTRSCEFQEGVDVIIKRLETVLEDGLSDGTVVALGEMGLDYDRLHYSEKHDQHIAFEAQLDFAERYSLPMFLHDRNTNGDFLQMISKHMDRLPAGGVVHSYTGTVEEMLEYSKLGLYIGINGCSMKTEENLLAVAAIPDHLLLLETDAPWCGIKNSHASNKFVTSKFPNVKKEKFVTGCMIKDRTEPCQMIQVLEAVAAIRNVDPVVLANQVFENTQRLFPTIYN